MHFTKNAMDILTASIRNDERPAIAECGGEADEKLPSALQQTATPAETIIWRRRSPTSCARSMPRKSGTEAEFPPLILKPDVCKQSSGTAFPPVIPLR